MNGKHQRFLIIFLFIIVVFSACTSYQLKHSDIGVPGVRKVDQYDNGKLIKSFYQMRDSQTGLWFEAEKGADGEWRFTHKGKEDRRDQREFLKRGF